MAQKRIFHLRIIINTKQCALCCSQWVNYQCQVRFSDLLTLTVQPGRRPAHWKVLANGAILVVQRFNIYVHHFSSLPGQRHIHVLPGRCRASEK